MSDNYKYFIIPSTFIASVFYIIPFELYFNAREYWNWNTNIVIIFAVIGLILNLLLVVVMKLMLRIDKVFVKNLAIVLFTSGIYILLADIFSPLQTTLLDGTGLTSKEPLYYTVIEGLILFFIVFGIFKFKWRIISSIGVTVSILLLTISITYLVVILTHPKENLTSYNRDKIGATPTGNVYHIVLDEMQADIAEIFLREEHAVDNFKGFMFFKRNVSNYLYTSASFPSYMTGTLYKNGDFVEWQDEVKRSGIIKSGYDKGYKVIFYTPRKKWCSPYISKCISLDDIYERISGKKDSQYKDFIQIWFARLLPNILTNEALAYGKELGDLFTSFRRSAKTRIPLSISEGKEPFSSLLMLKELIKTEKDRAADGLYIYAHAILPHGPYVITEDGSYDPNLRHKGTAGYYQQVKTAVNHVMEFLQELKRLGRYSKATIIIHGDTGHGHRGFIRKNGLSIAGSIDQSDDRKLSPFLNNSLGWSKDQVFSRIFALLMIKPANRTQPLLFSDKPTQLIDLYPSIMDLLKIDISTKNVDGISVFDTEFPNKRKAQFFLYPPEDSNPDMTKIMIADQTQLQNPDIEIQGGINELRFDADGILYDIGSSKEKGIKLNGFFGKESNPTRSYNWRWAGQDQSKMIFKKISFPEDQSLLFSFRVKPFIVNINKEMILETSLSRVKVKLKKNWNNYEVKLIFPANEKPVIKFYYEDSATPASLGINKDKRKLSVAWRRVSLNRIQ